MTPENKERIRLNLIDYITGTVDEWLRMAHFDQTPEDRDGIQYRISWEHPTEGAMIANIKETQYSEPLARFGVQVIVDALPDLPPIGPENDLGVYGIDDRAPEAPSEIDREAEENAALESGVPPEWVPAVFLLCLAGDRIRIGTQETDVIRCNSGNWHVDTSDYWQPKTWPHAELRMDLAANPGFREYPPQTPCEILCTPERRAVLEVMRAFPGTQRVDGSPVQK